MMEWEDKYSTVGGGHGFRRGSVVYTSGLISRNLTKIRETLQDELKSETAQKTRLSHKNEELQYKLRVNSEAMWQLVNRNMADERSLECSSIGNSPRSVPMLILMHSVGQQRN